MTEDEVPWPPLGLTGNNKKKNSFKCACSDLQEGFGGEMLTHSKQPLKINLSEVYGGKQDCPRIGQKMKNRVINDWNVLNNVAAN